MPSPVVICPANTIDELWSKAGSFLCDTTIGPDQTLKAIKDVFAFEASRPLDGSKIATRPRRAGDHCVDVLARHGRAPKTIEDGILIAAEKQVDDATEHDAGANMRASGRCLSSSVLL